MKVNFQLTIHFLDAKSAKTPQSPPSEIFAYSADSWRTLRPNFDCQGN